MHAVLDPQQKRNLMEITIDVPDYLYKQLQKIAATRREDIEELIIQAIEDQYA